MNPDPVATPADPDAAIRLSGVRAGYRGGPDILTDVSLYALPGQSLVIAGAPGAGKTTLLRLLHGSLAPRGGVGALLGLSLLGATEAQRSALRRRMGYVAQAPGLIDRASALANVVAAAILPGKNAPDAAAGSNARELLAYLGLSTREERPVAALSPSERRLVSIARAVLGRPAILLADDPVAGLATDLQGRVLRLIAQIARQGGAVVVTAQTPEPYAPLSAGIARLAGGRLVATAH